MTAVGRAIQPALGLWPAQQLHDALAGAVTTKGHLPWCNHGAWVNGFNNRRRHACDLVGCSGEGSPCIPRCAQVRAALKLEVGA